MGTTAVVDLSRMLKDEDLVTLEDVVCKALKMKTREEQERDAYRTKLQLFTTCEQFEKEWRYKGSKYFANVGGFDMWLELAITPQQIKLFFDLHPEKDCQYKHKEEAKQKLIAAIMPSIRSAESFERYQLIVRDIPKEWLEEFPEFQVEKDRVCSSIIGYTKNCQVIGKLMSEVRGLACAIKGYERWLRLCQKPNEYQQLVEHLEARMQAHVTETKLLQKSDQDVDKAFVLILEDAFTQLQNTLLNTLKQAENQSDVSHVLNDNYRNDPIVEEFAIQMLDTLLQSEYEAVKTSENAQALCDMLHPHCKLYLKTVQRWHELLKSEKISIQGTYDKLLRATLERAWYEYTSEWRRQYPNVQDAQKEYEFILSCLSPEYAQLIRDIVESFEEVNAKALEKATGNKKRLREFLDSWMWITPNLRSKHWDEGVRRLAAYYYVEAPSQ